MTTRKKRLALFPGLALTAMFGAGLLILALPGQATATTAANAVITNTATVSYSDAGSNPQTPIQATTNVTVNLVTATPALNDPGNPAASASGVAVNRTYTITSTANGPDDYTLSATTDAPQTGVTSTVQAFRDSGDGADLASLVITLGATSVYTGTTIAAAGTTAITVPNDGVAGGGLNGLVAGDTVVVNGAVHTVNAITADPATGTATITLNGNGTANVVTTGMLIAERFTFISKVTPVGTGAAPGTATVTIHAADGVSTVADEPTLYTINPIALTVTKYVANLTTPVVGGGSTVTLGGVTYYSSGVNGFPGQTLEYVIGIVNGATAAQATNVVISDPIPAFTTYVASSMKVDTTGNNSWDGGIADGDANGDAGEANGTTVYIYAGTGGTDGAAGFGNGTGGTLATSTTTYGAFRVTIQN